MNNIIDNYKFSKYNKLLKVQNKIYLYNFFTGGFASFSPEYEDLVSNCDFISEADLKKLTQVNNSLIEELIYGGFLIDKNVSEFKVLKTLHSLARFKGANTLVLTLLPTLGCNFRCPYCFEQGSNYPTSHMSEEVMDAIVDYIDDNLYENGSLMLSWYGGEPLVALQTIEKLYKKITVLTNKKNITITSSMITNGYFLTKDVVERLLKMDLSHLQVTIDGPREIHNETRILPNGKGTYDRIIDNIKEIDDRVNLSIRVNIQKQNFKYFNLLVEDLIKEDLNKKENIRIYCAPVRDFGTENNTIYSTCFTTNEFAQEEIKMNNILEDNGFIVGDDINPNISVCGAISENAIVIEPDGTLQKCWNVVGDKGESVGNILHSPENLDNNSKEMINLSKWYAWSAYEDDKCKSCPVLPQCMGGCPYYTVNKNIIFEEQEYRCSPNKYNIENKLVRLTGKGGG
ncbi:radical SAM/SPASM domain-containing protein [Vagococcus fluvialis]|uniref:Arylsulfatase regulator (Fe-S oxidoreductase) n=1 Tax=Vagococcus fluvialis bH819 TaxID=1255619 RepID=A0A1X6WNT2_9ENTE|nr:radical SAM protein [Vagococcus fluvialis]SLM85991.1 Arylsulfatase regulator (Fe-S oxidoreductase) [Vagococcus fluvialis bH819]